DLQRVGATERGVPRVEAERMRRRVKEPFDVLAPLDRGAPVRMNGNAETVRVGDLGDAVDAVDQLRPATLRDRRRSRVAGLRQRWGKDDELGPAGGQPFRLAFDRGELVRTASALVQHGGDETADEPQ